jgi:tetratricopeptide (TPR) repeat protein
MLARARLALIVLAVAAAPALALAQTPVESARALVARYHEDPTGIDRARALLEAAVARDPQVDTMVMLSFVHFLYGDVRATTTEDKLAAYDRGREIGKRAVELAPKNPEAHVWYGINTGRWGLTKGVMRSLFLLPTVRQEVDATLALDPRNLRALALSGNVFLEVPGLFGGDREKAEQQFRKALEIDPHFTVARVDLARVLIAGSRYADARRELQRVIDERTPNSIADWTAKDLPRARELLESIKGK